MRTLSYPIVRRATALLLAVYAIMVLAAPASAVNVTGWWRMEADNDPGSGYSIANEVVGGPSLIGTSGNIQATVPVNPIPQPPMVANNFALSGDNNVNGTIAPYAGLDVTSGTFEFYARANEGDARFLLRQTGATGLRIDVPNNLRVQYSTAAGQVTIQGGLNNFDANWDHVAFTYDEVTGVGNVYVNGALAGTNDGPDNQPLTWPAALPLQVGNGMDGGGGLIDQAIFDELRIANMALPPSQFLNGTAAAPPLFVAPTPPTELVRFNFDTLASAPADTVMPEIVSLDLVSNAPLNINPAVLNGTNNVDLRFEISNPGPNYATQPVLRVFPAGNNDQQEAFDNDGYYEFTIEPIDGKQLDLDSLVFDAARGGGATPRGWAVRTSIDGFTSVLDTADIPTARPTFTPYLIDLSGPEFQGLTDPLTFRVYVYSPGNGSTVEFDNLRVLGFATAPIPEPATFSLLALGGLAVLRRRRRQSV